MDAAEKQTILDALDTARFANTNETGQIDERFDALQTTLEERWNMESA